MILGRMGLGLGLGLGMGSSGSFSGVLDGLSATAYAAHGFHLLTRDWQGSAVCRFREDNTDTEDDFFASTSAVLTNGGGQTVAQWLAANSASNAFVRTLYDQTGNARDWTQVTNANQPLFSSTGFNNLPGALFNGVDQWMAGNGLVGAYTGGDSPSTTVGAFQIDPPYTTIKTMLGMANSGDANPLFIYRGKNTTEFVFTVLRRGNAGGTAVQQNYAINEDPNVHLWRHSGTQIDVNLNTDLVLDDVGMNTGTVTFNTVTLGAIRSNGATTGFLEGACATTIVFDIEVSDADREALL